MSFLLRRVALLVGIALAGALSAGLAAAQSPGLDASVPVGAFMNGVFPSQTPRDPASAQWDVVPAFPNVSLTDPLVIVTNPADDRLYVGSREGVIVSFPNQPNVSQTTPFLDLRDRVAVVWDGGFLGMAFDPQFGVPGSPHRGHVYVWYSSYCPIDATRRLVNLAACNPNYPTLPTDGFYGTWLRLSRFTVPDGQSVPDPASERVMINFRLFNSTHRGGGMVFANDGRFWLTIGDQWRYVTAQEITNTLEGKTLRLALDITENADGTWSCPAGSHQPIRAFGQPDPVNPSQMLGETDEVSGLLYCIPDDNPWPSPGGTNFEEPATLGHRNPHRLSKDAATGRLWSGEVGENTREEVNVLEMGHNYGWPFREGTVAGPKPPPEQIIGLLTDPVIDFDRNDANAIIGGYVYHGTRFPELEGRYIAGDYGTAKVWAITLDEASMRATATQIATFTPGSLGTLGQDKEGEIYLASVASTGPLYTLDRVTESIPDPPAHLSQLGAFTSLGSLAPASFWVPYGLNEPFWSDGARKSRWIALPNDGVRDTAAEQIGYAPNADWSFPNGTVVMKHFELPVDEANPSATTRLETRFLVKANDARWYGVTYRWRPDQSDADLLTTADTGDYTIQEAGGGTHTQTWLFPSRTQCLSCHNAGTTGALGIRTHQLNGDFTYPSTGRTDNQLVTWGHLGMLSPAPDPATVPTLLRAHAHDDPSASLEDRARSWFDANCSNCHRPGTGNRALFDARLTTPLASQGFVWGGVIDDLGIPDAFLVSPGSPFQSIVWQRGASAGTSYAMPPLAKTLVHEDAVQRLSAWIERVSPSFPRNGVNFEYYQVSGLTQLPDFDQLTPLLTGATGTFDISYGFGRDDFAFRFRGVIQIDVAGAYTFYTTSDDGSRLWIDGSLVVDNDGLHSAVEASGAVSLAAGFHDVEVGFFERGGQESLSVSYAGPGIAKQPVPPKLLFPTIPVPLQNQPPTLVSPNNRFVGEKQPVSLQLVASDPDGNALWFEASGLPTGLGLDHETGLISGTPTVPGTYDVIVGASDGPAAASASFQWVVGARPCDDGRDNDGDGLVDYPNDPGCATASSSTESPKCQDGIDNDGDGRIDFDGGQSIHGACSGGTCPPGVSDPDHDGVANPDPQCTAASRNSESSSRSCGLGFELVFALPLLARLARLRRR